MRAHAASALRALMIVLIWTGAAASAGAQAPDWPTESPPRPLQARDVKFPPYQMQTLPNGLRVVVVLHHEQPVVSMRLLIRAGAASDPREKLGAAHLTATLLDQGTTTRSAQEVADQIDFIGGAESTGAGSDLSFLNLVVMKDSFGVGLRMLSDMARSPAFDASEIERQRQQTLSSLRVQEEDPGYIADAVFDRLVYGFHPYGLPGTGTPETLAAITRDDLVAFHAQYYVANNAILAIVGDVTAEEAFSEVRAVFGGWASRPIPADRSIDPPEPARRLIVINKPDAVQTEVRVGHLGIPRNHPDYMAVNLAIRVLGGEGSNRLHQVLRTSRGLTYGAQADMDALKRSGDFQAETNTRSEATAEVLRLIVEEFSRLQRDRVNDIELMDAKAYMTGSFPLTIETPNAIATQVLNVLFYDLPIEDLQTFRERVNAITVDDVQRVARQFLRPDRLSVVLVGNASSFASQLNGVGFAAFETIDLGDLDLMAVGFKRGRAVARAPDMPDTAGAMADVQAVRTDAAYRPIGQQSVSAGAEPDAAAARALLSQILATKGGLDRLRSIRRITAKATTTMWSPDGTVEGTTTTYLEYPNHVRVETQMKDATIQQVYDGEHAWVRDPMGVHDVPAPFLREFDASLKRDTIALLLAAEDGRARIRVLPDVKDESGTMSRVLEVSGSDLEPIVLYVNPATWQIDRQTYIGGGQDRPLIEERFSDYRSVDGLQVAFSAAIRRSGQQVLERRFSEVAINAPIEAGLFKRPTS